MTTSHESAERTAENSLAITVNGENQTVLSGAVLETIVRSTLTLDDSAALPGGIAAAVNDEVIPRSGWAGHLVASDDRIEILSAVQGG